MFMLTISSIGYLKGSVQSSYLGKRIFLIAPDTYSWLWNSIVSKFSSSEKYNEGVTTTSEEFLKQ
jgi:hypothetical protein